MVSWGQRGARGGTYNTPKVTTSSFAHLLGASLALDAALVVHLSAGVVDGVRRSKMKSETAIEAGIMTAGSGVYISGRPTTHRHCRG